VTVTRLSLSFLLVLVTNIRRGRTSCPLINPMGHLGRNSHQKGSGLNMKSDNSTGCVKEMTTFPIFNYTKCSECGLNHETGVKWKKHCCKCREIYKALIYKTPHVCGENQTEVSSMIPTRIKFERQAPDSKSRD
jgi:hypothetical protein